MIQDSPPLFSIASDRFWFRFCSAVVRICCNDFFCSSVKFELSIENHEGSWLGNSKEERIINKLLSLSHHHFNPTSHDIGEEQIFVNIFWTLFFVQWCCETFKCSFFPFVKVLIVGIIFIGVAVFDCCNDF